MTLHELDSASAVNDFKSTHANTLLCFSATWCGPCKASKPQLESLASSYANDPSVDVKFGIVYEHNLSEGIHEFGVRAFPTYILYTGNGLVQAGKIEGVNFEGIKKLIAESGCKRDMGKGYSLGGSGGGDATSLSAAEARAQRLAMFEKKVPAAAAAAAGPSTDQEGTDENENTPMEIETEIEAGAIEEDTTVSKAETETKEEDKEEDKDVEMKDAQESTTETTCTVVPETEMVDPTADLSKEHLETLTGAMGFSLLRAQKGLLNGSNNVEGAVEWLMAHQDDADIDEPIPLVPKQSPAAGAVAQSYKCNECGKILSNMANLELHANKTGHSDFEESTQAVKALTAEEKAAKVAEIKELLKAKRMQREAEEKVDHVERERQRRSMGQQMSKTKEEMERQAMSRQAQQRKKEKEAFKRERARIRAELEKDKAERRAHKGKLQSKLGIDGYHPDAIQYDVGNEEEAQSPAPTKKKPRGSVAKIDEYISKVAAYRAGGDGGKCLKVLLLYIKNVVENPDDDKYRHIKMDNKTFKTKVKPFVGAKSLLLAVGFSPNEAGTALDLDEHADREVISQTKEKLEAALAAY